MNKVLSIVIPVFNKWNFTKSCLNDLSHLPDNHEIIVIDNGSADETKTELMKINDPKIKIIRNEENLFHSRACNQGYSAAEADVVLFLNNDVRVKSNHNCWTDPFYQSEGELRLVDIGLVGPTMGQLDNQFNFVREANQKLTGNVYISGWCLAASKTILQKLERVPGQPWDERYPMYFNDSHLGQVCKKKNIPMNVISLPDICHFGKISSAQLNVHKLYNEGRKVFLQDWQKK